MADVDLADVVLEAEVPASSEVPTGASSDAPASSADSAVMETDRSEGTSTPVADEVTTDDVLAEEAEGEESVLVELPSPDRALAVGGLDWDEVSGKLFKL